MREADVQPDGDPETRRRRDHQRRNEVQAEMLRVLFERRQSRERGEPERREPDHN